MKESINERILFQKLKSGSLAKQSQPMNRNDTNKGKQYFGVKLSWSNSSLRNAEFPFQFRRMNSKEIALLSVDCQEITKESHSGFPISGRTSISSQCQQEQACKLILLDSKNRMQWNRASCLTET
jgi:hypothetical protein